MRSELVIGLAALVLIFPLVLFYQSRGLSDEPSHQDLQWGNVERGLQLQFEMAQSIVEQQLLHVEWDDGPDDFRVDEEWLAALLEDAVALRSSNPITVKLIRNANHLLERLHEVIQPVVQHDRESVGNVHPRASMGPYQSKIPTVTVAQRHWPAVTHGEDCGPANTVCTNGGGDIKSRTERGGGRGRDKRGK